MEEKIVEYGIRNKVKIRINTKQIIYRIKDNVELVLWPSYMFQCH